MQPFSYARPGTLAEAVELLRGHGGGARVLAGGTDLVIRLRDGSCAGGRGRREARAGVRARIRAGADGRLVIGATTTMTEIAGTQ